MALFATFVAAPYRDGERTGARTYGLVGMAPNESVATTQTMNRLVETSPPGREYGTRPQVASQEVSAWQLRQAQQPGNGLYMVGVMSASQTPGVGNSVTVSARVVVASDADSAKRMALAEFSRQSPGARVVDAMTVAASPDVVSRALREWDRQRGHQQQQDAALRSAATLPTPTPVRQTRQEPSQREASTGSAAGRGEFNVREYAQKVIDTYRANVRYIADHGEAVSRTVYAHSKRAADQGVSNLRDAARVAGATITAYQAAQARGVYHLQARQQVAQAMAERYDSRGRDTQQERQQARGMSR